MESTKERRFRVKSGGGKSEAMGLDAAKKENKTRTTPTVTPSRTYKNTPSRIELTRRPAQ